MIQNNSPTRFLHHGQSLNTHLQPQRSFKMRFSLNFVLLGAASVANAFLSPSQLIRGIDDLVHKTEDLIKPAGQLSVSNAPQLIRGSGPFFASPTTAVYGAFLIEVGSHYWFEGCDS